MIEALPDDGLWAPRGPLARGLLLAGLVPNLAASLSMATYLAPSTVAGGDPAARAAYIAAHTWLVPAGWYLWIAASSGLLLVFLVALRALPGRPAVKQLALVLLVIGLVPDLASSLVGGAILPGLAPRLVASPHDDGLVALFLAWDRWGTVLTGIVGNVFYGAAGWVLTWQQHRTAGFPRPLVWLSVPLWTATFAIPVAAALDSAPALVASLGATMALFTLWGAAFAATWLGRSDP